MNDNVRKSGNSAGTTIPVPILDTEEMSLGEKMNVEAKAGQLIMTLVDEPMTLGDLLADCPKDSFKILVEDQGWMDSRSSGREI